MADDLPRVTAPRVLQNGSFPSRRPDRTWAGSGVGTPWAIC